MTNRGLSQEFIEEVISKNDIVSVISKYVTLTRKGNNYWACCPFHMEKTPSMSVKEDGQFFKCFGCGESGNVISFIRKIENVDFLKAIEILCENANMKMPTLQDDADMVAKKKIHDRMLLCLKNTCEFYQNNLKLAGSKDYHLYLDKRGLNDAMIEKFKIGASLNYDSLVSHLKNLGFTEEEMISSGVVGKNERGNLYDFYAKRLTFPIMNNLGEVVGFSARDISGDAHTAKYKNTPQTMLFNKSSLIYGYHFLRDLKKMHLLDSIIIVEGQMDVIACHQAGITNVVGCMGTALTSIHARNLANLATNIILCLDGDGAGNSATYKAINALKDANLNLKVVRLNKAKDPDEYIKKFGKDQFIDEITNAMNCMEFILIDSAKQYDLTNNNDKNKYVQEALGYLSKLSTPSEQEIYLHVLREIVRIPVDVLRNTLNGAKQETKKEIVEEEQELPSQNFINSALIFILASILYGKIKNINDYSAIFNSSKEFQPIYEYMVSKINENGSINASTIYLDFDVQNGSNWDKIINYVFPDPSIYNTFAEETIKRLRISLLKTRKSELTQKMQITNSLDEKYDLLNKLKQIDNEIAKLK